MPINLEIWILQKKREHNKKTAESFLIFNPLPHMQNLECCIIFYE